MAYASNADIEERLGSAVYVQLTDDAGTGAADEDKVTEARLAAEGEVDSYLGRRYAVPVDASAEATLAALLKSIVLDLAEYRLHGRRPPVPEAVREKRQSAVNWLGQVAVGKLALPSVAELPANTSQGFYAASTSAERVMSRDELEDL